MTARTARTTARTARTAQRASDYANDCAVCALPRRGRRRSRAVARSGPRRRIDVYEHRAVEERKALSITRFVDPSK